MRVGASIAVEEHRNILAALESRNPAQAERQTSKHMATGMAYFSSDKSGVND
jgi:DNA-binding GntR family transcriptional regulator